MRLVSPIYNMLQHLAAYHLANVAAVGRKERMMGKGVFSPLTSAALSRKGHVLQLTVHCTIMIRTTMYLHCHLILWVRSKKGETFVFLLAMCFVYQSLSYILERSGTF